MKFLRTWLRRIAYAVLALVLAAVVFLWPLERSWQAGELLVELAEVPARAGEVPAGVSRRPIRYQVDGRLHLGDLYAGPAPGAGGPDRISGVVLVPGLTPYGKDDSHVVATAGLLAKQGFAVLVPELPAIRRLKVRASHGRDVADATRHLAERLAAKKVGVLAVSYSAGPAVLAALDAQGRDRIGYVAAIGGYFDLVAVITFFTTGHHRTGDGAPWMRLEPNPIGRWIFARGNASDGLSLRDQGLLRRIAELRAENPEAAIANLTAELSDDGRRVMDLLTNRDPARVPALLATLPRQQQRALKALNLKGKDLGKITADLILLHGKGDRIIPWTESQKLASAVPGRARLYLPGNLDHVEIAPGSVADMYAMWRAVRDLLAMRDRHAVPVTSMKGKDGG